MIIYDDIMIITHTRTHTKHKTQEKYNKTTIQIKHTRKLTKRNR